MPLSIILLLGGKRPAHRERVEAWRLSVTKQEVSLGSVRLPSGWTLAGSGSQTLLRSAKASGSAASLALRLTN